MKNQVGVLPLGAVPAMAVKVIAANISAYYKWPARVLPGLGIPEKAFDGARLKYDAGIIINQMKLLNSYDDAKIVAVMAEDIFIPVFNYVYGQAIQGGRFALISLFRLKRNTDGSALKPSLFYERAAKVALHELGHLFNLYHCNEKRCVMHFTGAVEELDSIPFYLCRACERRLKF